MDRDGLRITSYNVCYTKLLRIPIHFHTHDTSGIAAASVLAAAVLEKVRARLAGVSALVLQDYDKSYNFV